MLPIEFARISQGERLTLVIRPGSADQPTYWAFSEFATVEEARNNVRARENSRLDAIHHVLRDARAAEVALREIVDDFSLALPKLEQALHRLMSECEAAIGSWNVSKDTHLVREL